MDAFSAGLADWTASIFSFSCFLLHSCGRGRSPKIVLNTLARFCFVLFYALLCFDLTPKLFSINNLSAVLFSGLSYTALAL